MMRRRAGFNANDARWQLLEERQYIPALDLAANQHVPCRVVAVDLKYRPCNVETDRPNRLHAWLSRLLVAPSATAPCHLRGGGGAVHGIKSRRWATPMICHPSVQNA